MTTKSEQNVEPLSFHDEVVYETPKLNYHLKVYDHEDLGGDQLPQTA